MAEVKGYSGWTLFDKVLIVAKKLGHWDFQQNQYVEDEDWQGYIVDPANKKMKENALRWAETCISKYDENGKYCGYDRTPGEEFLYDNDGFRLELKETAGGSSQGGKLSFWNCWVTAIDGKRFKVGIAADLLLDLLMSTTFENGRCKENVFFARQTGGVGMLHKGMDSYQQALADMQKKQDIKSKKTSKHVLGHAYSALNLVEAYVADLYVHYEPVVRTYPRTYGYRTETVSEVIGFKKLENPLKLKWFPHLYDYKPGDVIKLSQGKYFDFDAEMLKAKLPARLDAGVAIEYDITIEEAVNKYYWDKWIRNYDETKDHWCRHFYPHEKFGVSTSETECPIPPEVLTILKRRGLTLVD